MPAEDSDSAGTVEVTANDGIGSRRDDSVLISVLATLPELVRSRAALQFEVLALRHQLLVRTSSLTTFKRLVAGGVRLDTYPGVELSTEKQQAGMDAD